MRETGVFLFASIKFLAFRAQYNIKFLAVNIKFLAFGAILLIVVVLFSVYYTH